MEKKDWRHDLLEIGEIPDGSEETVFVEFHLDTLNDFINKVVDKAREEGKREAVDIILDKNSDVLDIAVKDGGWDYEYYLKLKDNK
jgi:hypothetical protein